MIGSALLGQNFTEPRVLPPAAVGRRSDGYDAAASSGSNLGPTNPKLIDAVKERAAAYREENGLAASARCRWMR